MILEMDNKGAVDMANNWSVGGRTKHIDVKYLWLRELKEQSIIRVVWTSAELNDADLFTKNLPAPVFTSMPKSLLERMLMIESLS